MSNEEIARAFHEVYNEYWLRYRKSNLQKDDEEGWDRLRDEGFAIIRKYGEHDLVKHMVIDLMNELDRRMRQGENKS